MTCFQEKYYRVCIARAAVNESVCEDSHAEHVQVATAAVSTPFRTELKSLCKYSSRINQVDTKYLMVKTRTGNLTL